MKYSPIVRSSAPPLERSITCWKTPLPNERVPTTVAPPWSASAAARISAAEAVSRSIRTTIGCGGRLSADGPVDLLPWVRDRVETTTSSSGRKTLEVSTASWQQPAAVAAQVEDEPLGAARRATRSHRLSQGARERPR